MSYLGLFLIALATLMLEILLTRIFSVTLWYHLAFVAVSIAMFGMTLGAVIVYAGARWFTPARAPLNLALACALFGVTAVVSVSVHLDMAIDPGAISSALVDLSRAYGVIAVPFVFSGIAIAIALTRDPANVGRLYAADLAGAAIGCVLLIPLVDAIGAPRAVVAVGIIGGLAAIAFAIEPARAGGRRLARAAIGALAIAAIIAGASINPQALEIRYAKGERWVKPLYEHWNSHSRVAVTLDREEAPFGWGFSRFVPIVPTRQLHLNIDASAETVMTGFNGDLKAVDYLRYDVVNAGLHLLDGGSVYVVGAGGGRDVLSALTLGASRVVAVEVNRGILDAVNGVFGELTGHLDRDPRVRFVHDEARSYLARSGEQFDFIQISLIDTWAATAAGAFVLSENTLYTRDAWRTFFNGLSDRGMISVSRWYARPEPQELYKAVALATTSLRDAGIADTRRHIVVIAQLYKQKGEETWPGVGTLLVRKAPFTDADLARLSQLAEKMDFDIVLSPRHNATPMFARLGSGTALDDTIASSPLDLSPPDDNRPFFFRMDDGLLNGLLGFVVAVAVVLIVVPVLVKTDFAALLREGWLSIAFVAFGVGFMLIEISQMMRLTLLLGHPTFSLSVVLFGLLLASGAGSASTARLPVDGLGRAVSRRMGALVIALIVLGVATPIAVDAMHTAPTAVRIATALALLVPAGFLMGMAFPIGMGIAMKREPRLGAWLWGVNGAASVCATVLAVAIASRWGIGAAWWAGTACYVFAGAILASAARTRQPVL